MKTIILSSLVLPLLSFAAKTSSWSQWRGPDRNGMISKDSAWPAKIDKKTLTEKMESLSRKRIFRPGGFRKPCFHNRIGRRIRIDVRLRSQRWQTCMANAMGGKNESPFFCRKEWQLDSLNSHFRWKQFVCLWYARCFTLT